jgi:hypothetical protein
MRLATKACAAGMRSSRDADDDCLKLAAIDLYSWARAAEPETRVFKPRQAADPVRAFTAGRRDAMIFLIKKLIRYLRGRRDQG